MKSAHTKNEALSTGAERLTVEAARDHLEILEVRECAPFRRDAAGELVRRDAAGELVVAVAKVEHLE